MQVLDCVAQLPDGQRIAVTLWLETEGGMTLADLAAILGASVTTAHRVLHGAFAALRECLRGGEEGQGTQES